MMAEELTDKEIAFLPPWVQNIAWLAMEKAPAKTIKLSPSTVLRLCKLIIPKGKEAK